MSASEILLHQSFEQIVAQYHPFAEYIGYKECEDGFILCYRGSGGDKYMSLDTNLNVVDDQTLGTARTLGIAAVAIGILDIFFGGNQNRY